MSHAPLNFLWISLEDCSPRFGCYGDTVARTPHIDALAAEGRLYSRAFSTAPVCAPARAAIITGTYAAAIGAHHMRTGEGPDLLRPLPPYECVPPPFVKILPEYLRAAGYYCTNNSKTDYQFASPFTGWDECHGSAHWRNRPDPAQPFFAVFNPFATHESGMWATRRATPRTDPARVVLPPYLADTPETRLCLARQYDNIADCDTVVGELLRQLAEDGLAETTVVFLWSDHGEGLPRHKRWPYDGGLRVPLIVRWPGRVAPGEVCDDLVSTIDLAPTVLASAGIPPPVHLQGQIFLGDRAAPPRVHVFATRDRYDQFYDCMRVVRSRRFAYVRNYHPELTTALWNSYLNQHPAQRELWRLRRAGALDEHTNFHFRESRRPEELYDLETDPHQLTNLCDRPEHAATLAELRSALDEWQREVGDLYREPEDQMLERFWPGRRQPVTSAPLWIAYDDTNDGTSPAEASVRLCSPALLQLYAPTHGASIGWRFENDPGGRWRLYTGLIELPPSGSFVLEAKAIRLGYAESPTTRLHVEVSETDPRHQSTPQDPGHRPAST